MKCDKCGTCVNEANDDGEQLSGGIIYSKSHTETRCLAAQLASMTKRAEDADACLRRYRHAVGLVISFLQRVEHDESASLDPLLKRLSAIRASGIDPSKDPKTSPHPYVTVSDIDATIAKLAMTKHKAFEGWAHAGQVQKERDEARAKLATAVEGIRAASVYAHVFADLPMETSPPRNHLQIIAVKCEGLLRAIGIDPSKETP